MKRWLLKLALFLLLGAIVNVAVAWGCGFNLRHWPLSETVRGDLRWWQSNAPAGFAQAEAAQSFDRFTPLGGECLQWPERGLMAGCQHFAQRERFGLPTLSMERSYWSDRWRKESIHKYSWQVSWLGERTPRLPLRPLWPGFAINTVFYAAVLWLLFAAPFALRRRLRIKRGLCPACAYPIGDSLVCTECGKPVKGAEALS